MKMTCILGSALIILTPLAACLAFADSYEHGYPVTPQAKGTLTREQVRADQIDQAFRSGELVAARNDKKYPIIQDNFPAKTRAQVRAELVQSRNDNGISKYHH